jgi:hypothetical protein
MFAYASRRREKALELVEGVAPALAMEVQAPFGLERPLRQDDLGRVTEISELESGERLDVVGSGSAQMKVKASPSGGSTRRNSPARWKASPSGGRISLRYRSPTRALNSRLRIAKALGTPPLRQHVGVGERLEDDRSSSGKNALDLEREPG